MSIGLGSFNDGSKFIPRIKKFLCSGNHEYLRGEELGMGLKGFSGLHATGKLLRKKERKERSGALQGWEFENPDIIVQARTNKGGKLGDQGDRC